MGKEIREEILCHQANIAPDMVVEDQAGCHCRFVLPSPTRPFPL